MIKQLIFLIFLFLTLSFYPYFVWAHTIHTNTETLKKINIIFNDPKLSNKDLSNRIYLISNYFLGTPYLAYNLKLDFIIHLNN